MRVASPCTENLDAMPRTKDGAFLCGKCDRAVVDLRRAPRKRALAVIDGLRREGDGSVCVRVRATRDGTPVFAPDPSPLARFVGPLALVGSLAACSPGVSAGRGTTPIVLTDALPEPVPANGNGTPGTQPVRAVVAPPVTPTTTNVSYPDYDVTEVAGGLAFSGP